MTLLVRVGHREGELELAVPEGAPVPLSVMISEFVPAFQVTVELAQLTELLLVL